MEFEHIERILDLMRQHDLAEFELEREGLKLRVRKASAGSPAVQVPLAVMPALAPSSAAAPPPAHAPAAAAPAAPEEREEVELAVVKSPIVGTFYLASEPGAPPFVQVGQRVKKDQVLCII